MPVIIVDAVTKEPREYKGRKKWGVKPQGWSEWLNMYCDFKPQKGQSFSVNITETQGKDGRIFKDAEIIGPAPGVPPPPPPQTPSVEAAFNQLKHNGKIPWSDWSRMCKAAHELACWLESDDQGEHICERSNARAALVNTVMIAFSNGKLELPVVGILMDDDGVVGANSEAKDDDIPW